MAIDLDGNEHNFNIPDKLAQGNKRKCSNLHVLGRDTIKTKYPSMIFYEEMPVQVNPKKKLYFDFYIPTFNLVIEVNGKQHYDFTSRFYKNRMEFLKAQQNDELKRQWCELNDINLIVFKYDETKLWEDLI